MTALGGCLSLVTLVAAGILLRATVSLYSYSGHGKRPMFGDFEAQRHWQEVTVNLPIADWYRNTTDNDLLYWGLDYPPLTAYHSFLVGKWAQLQDPKFVELHKSRGITNQGHKRFMRNTVLLADLLIYIPAVLLACHAVRKTIHRESATGVDLLFMATAILYPGQLLIDNGHFQYNNISLGFAAAAIAAILRNRNLLGAFFFVLALNYKQMELYHALPFFFYLLASCFKSTKGFSLGSGLWKLIKLGALVLATFAVLWSPWLGSVDSALQVLHRVFPVARGVFEDKVSNVWCIVNVFVKLRNFDNAHMAIVCLTCTLFAVLPSCVHLLFHSTSKRNFLLALANSALGFFLFSFQVHEKSILLAALPITLLFPLYPAQCFWFLQIATFSMVPLLAKDGLVGPYLGLTVLTLAFLKISLGFLTNFTLKPSFCTLDAFGVESLFKGKRAIPSRWDISLVHLYYASLVAQAMLLLAFQYVPAPPQLPFLWPLLISAFSCGHFVLFFVYFNCQQLLSNGDLKIVDKKDGAVGKTNKRKVK
ncbi:probable dolichyl pyrophosphate Man9GlcNAc2 alpha-1,3-glucosyltransferase [Culex pipiens pallens]|uniref:probable dolichyl pyrophosphate Man9GlcNAc2 alpha-1,3-glucosyltransferase n=1 Tax=Culex pipiens pallens TaxID=42434 RepID=UPI001954B949|nr:probable dolichyl pyrophosphate Man9GlcNAc2 alpha-1,3-glucosyltransferase [Culex pipiens pallens]